MRIRTADLKTGATYRDRASQAFVVLNNDNEDGTWSATTLPACELVTVKTKDLEYVAVVQQARDGGI
jgi:hypothetical protein